MIFIYNVVFILFTFIFKFTFMFQQTWKSLLDKCSKTFMFMIESFFYITCYIYLILGQFIGLFG